MTVKKLETPGGIAQAPTPKPAPKPGELAPGWHYNEATKSWRLVEG